MSVSTAATTAKLAPSLSNITITSLPPLRPPNYTPSHHVGKPPTHFTNPWPSAIATHSLASVVKTRFFNSAEKNFVPVPTDRSLLVPVTKPTWGHSADGGQSKLKATWIGHASFLVEFPTLSTSARRGLRVALDPVFSTRMSPVSFLGPKRFTPPPCTLEDLPNVDLVCISHNHYDHLDAATIKFIHQRENGRVKFLCGLGVGRSLEGMGVKAEEILEMDWWDRARVRVSERGGEDSGMERLVGEVDVVCTPSQHNSGRSITDQGQALWCSFAIEEVLNIHADRDQTASTAVDKSLDSSSCHMVGQQELSTSNDVVGKKLFFAGDTAYRCIPQHATDEEIAKVPVCPAFKTIGQQFGPFDLALLPIGCYSPRWWMSAVHCAPEDSICIHRDIRSKKSIGMHYGTVRGGISQYYEDVTEPPQRWKAACQNAGLTWDEEIGLCSIGETVSV